jgi:hypothetical protein
VKTLSTLSPEEWKEIREDFRVSKLLIWRAPSHEDRKRGQRKPVGVRRLDDGTYEVQINADAVRCRPRSVSREQYTLYALYQCLGHIALGHLDGERQREMLASRLRRGGRPGLKALRTQLDDAASEWALKRLQEDDSAGRDLHRPFGGLELAAS